MKTKRDEAIDGVKQFLGDRPYDTATWIDMKRGNNKEGGLAIFMLVIAISVGSFMGYGAFQEGLPLWLSVIIGVFIGFLSLFCGMLVIVEG